MGEIVSISNLGKVQGSSNENPGEAQGSNSEKRRLMGEGEKSS